ncbi:rRNA-processing protein EBP2 [Golovinomyces cichoracearum]|uniref:rRNA-processing protein EBP2 n=1 Tax=Golovinomyces cichoracearum TaxID=62708 RepID=A0A420ISV1_9PEZI|nr:rRNA-processing protein EBP2 [Golovinomyces cichoracearum]
MVAKSKLKMALAVEKGIDFKKLKIKKKEKAAKKAVVLAGSNSQPSDAARKTQNEGDENKENDQVVNKNLIDSETKEGRFTEKVDSFEGELAGIDESDSDSSIDETSVDNDNEDEDIPVSDLEDIDEEEKEDLIPHQRLTIYNSNSLSAALKRIALPISKVPFFEHQSVVTSEPVVISDISDDLNRELAFYAQCLTAAQQGRKKLKEENVLFTRPTDYFAEMVKPDEHMAKIKAKLIDEAASKKASAEARKQRDLKKFGKQVQVAKVQERDKERKQTLEKIKVLKRKRQGTDTVNEKEADMFDVAVDEEIGATTQSRNHRDGSNRRQKKDEKFGFGGKKKFKKSGDAVSSGDLRGFSSKKMKGGTKFRPGKSRRASKR